MEEGCLSLHSRTVSCLLWASYTPREGGRAVLTEPRQTLAGWWEKGPHQKEATSRVPEVGLGGCLMGSERYIEILSGGLQKTNKASVLVRVPPGGSDGKESACHAGDLDLTPGL